MLTSLVHAVLAHDPPFVFADVALDVPMNNAAAPSLFANPTFVMFMLGLIGMALAAHPLHRLALLLKAREALLSASHPTEAKALGAGAALADILDAYLSANGQNVKDLADPAKRAAARTHLINAAEATLASKLAASSTVAGVPL